MDADNLSVEYADDMMVDVLEADDNLKTNDVLKPSPSASESGIAWVPIETASTAYPFCAFLSCCLTLPRTASGRERNYLHYRGTALDPPHAQSALSALPA